MFSRIAIIFIVTGLGQICSVFVLKYLVEYSPPEQIKDIVEIETTTQFIISLIAFGLQSSAIRDLALLPNWKEEFNKVQTARFTLGLLLIIACGFFIYDKQYMYFIIAPLLALNGDYALYAKGYSITGSLIAFSRVVIPLLFPIGAFFFFPAWISVSYFIGVTFSFLTTSVIISFVLKTDFLVRPKLGSLLLYLKTIPLGVISLSLYFFGLGILLVADSILDDSNLAIAFLALKFYLIYKGVLRVLHQAFIKDMLDDKVCLKIDQLSFMIGLSYLASTVIFPETFISIFFGDQFSDQKLFFEIVSFSALIYSLFLSMTTRALMDRQDKKYFLLAMTSVFISIAGLFVLSVYFADLIAVGLSLLIGEVIFSFGLAFLFLQPAQIRYRILFILKIVPFLTVPVLFRFWRGDTFINYVVSFALLGALLLIVSYNTIKDRPLKHHIS